MKITTGFNGDIDLISQLAQYNVESIYTKMTHDIVGGGRPSFLLPEIKEADIKRIIEKAHENNLKFYYLLNSACQGNLEYTRRHNNAIIKFIGKLSEMGVDGIVAATPYMLDLVKKNFPHLCVSISVFTYIDSVEQAKHWYNRGANRLILHPDVNRNFELLRNIRRAVDCELELFANDVCLHQCPYSYAHATASSHASSSRDRNNGFVITYELYNCTIDKLCTPANLIKARWIRPEDLSCYEELGINTIKLIDRMKNSGWILNTVKAYTEREYKGNLVDIVPFPMVKGDSEDFMINTGVTRLIKPKYINLSLIRKQRELEFPEVCIDNTKLDNFINYFKSDRCREHVCGTTCTYCYDVAEEVVTLDKSKVNKIVAALTDMRNMLIDGRAFKRNSVIMHIVGFFVRLLLPKKNRFYYARKVYPTE